MRTLLLWFTALFCRFITKNCMTFYKTKSRINPWLSEKISMRVFLSRVSLNTLWQIPTTALSFSNGVNSLG
jgi:hypothetical protein